jgi:hypothetical protein
VPTVIDYAEPGPLTNLDWAPAELVGPITGNDHDELLDEVATVCAADDPAAIAGLYAREELPVPAQLIC